MDKATQKSEPFIPDCTAPTGPSCRVSVFSKSEFTPHAISDVTLKVQHVFKAQIVIEQWRNHDHTKPSHNTLGRRPPASETVVTIDRTPIMH